MLYVVTAAAIVRFGLGAAWEIGALVEASLVFIGFSAWLVVAARNWLWASVAVFAAMVAALTNIIRLLLRHGDEHGLSPLADPAGDHHLRPLPGWSSAVTTTSVCSIVVVVSSITAAVNGCRL